MVTEKHSFSARRRLDAVDRERTLNPHIVLHPDDGWGAPPKGLEHSPIAATADKALP